MITGHRVLTVTEATFLLVAKVDADANPGLVRRYGTLALPSLLVFVDGVERARIVGARPKGRLLAELAQVLPRP
jgi:thioredoxin 1